MAAVRADNDIEEFLVQDEVDRLGRALESAEFRSLLCNYAREIQDPANQELYESEVRALERERGVDCVFLHPTPGYVIKTTNLRTDEKVFVNVCSDPHVRPPASQEVHGGEAGTRWSVPYLQAAPRKDLDKGGRPCTVYDVIFHPETLSLAAGQNRLRRMVSDTALDAVEGAYGVKLERDAVRFPKLKVKGRFPPIVIRKPLNEGGPSEPHHVLKYRHTGSETIGRPSHVVVEIHLPLVADTKGIDLDVTERQLTLSSPQYRLSVPFSYPAAEEEATARFDKSTKELTVTVPVLATEIERLSSTDSGVEADTDTADWGVASFGSDVHEIAPAAPECEQYLEEEDLLFPPYSCNVYEDLMIFTLDVKNVEEATLVKSAIPEEPFGFCVKFWSLGKGRVPFTYGFYCAFIIPPGQSVREAVDPTEQLEVEVWDNNVIIKTPLPEGATCEQYKVGASVNDLTIHSLPQLRALRKKKEEKLQPSSVIFKSVDEPSASKAYFDKPTSTSSDVSTSKSESCGDEKERHESGESEDSVFGPSSFASGDKSSSERGLRGILKQRCFSESQTELLSWSESSLDEKSSCDKKSVRFNEVVQRKVFRPSSSVTGMSAKNRKKKEQKRKRLERRTSEGDATTTDEEDQHNKRDEDEEEDEEEEDEGVTSDAVKEEKESMVDDQQLEQPQSRKGKRGNRRKNSRQKRNKVLLESASDLIFDLDI